MWLLLLTVISVNGGFGSRDGKQDHPPTLPVNEDLSALPIRS